MRTEGILNFINSNSETNLQLPSSDLMRNTGRETQSGEAIYNVSLNLITTNEDALQPRRELTHSHDGASYQRKNHVAQLRKPLLDPKKDLDPIVIAWAKDETTATNTGYSWVVVDGHHRLGAYRTTKGRKTIPAIVFEGSPTQVVLRAISGNNRDKLAMTPKEKLSTGWSIFVAMAGKKRQSITVQELGISRGSVQNFRKQFRLIAADIASGKLEDTTIGNYEWPEARNYPDTYGGDWEEAEDEAYIAGLAEKLFKTFGHTLMNGDVSNIGKALERHLGENQFKAIFEFYALDECDWNDGNGPVSIKYREPEPDF